jgi:adenylosuccinate synthase
VQSDSRIYLNSGSVIYPPLLLKEIEEHGVKDRILIHPNAVVVTDEDIARETWTSSQNAAIASTQKGVGQAISHKILRVAKTAKDTPEIARMCGDFDFNTALANGASVLIEIPQGYSLGINAGFYPYCTSRQCGVLQGLTDAQIHPMHLGQVAVALRTYPIRVGAVPGVQGSTSGPVYEDQEELTWGDLAVEPERTTVTGRIRRVFTWSKLQTLNMIRENQPDVFFINFCNYSQTAANQLRDFIQFNHLWQFYPNFLYGYGPNVEDVKNG